jgi:hypothetical protein
MSDEDREKIEQLQKLGWKFQRSCPDDLRVAGLMVAVHNDYTLDGVAMTFWLMTYAIPAEEQGFRDGVKTLAFRGEGRTDEEALDAIRVAWALYSDKLHHAPMCPANHYHGQRAPTYQCTCGAVEQQQRGES